ncbi:MAG: hypothetical protein ACFFDB_17865 [Promethearchaeota archaeon]
MHQIQLKRFKQGNLIKDISAFILLFFGIIGYVLLLISLYLPWRSIITLDMNNGTWVSHIYYFDFLGNNFTTISLLIESIFGLIIIFGLVLNWGRRKLHTLPSLITFGILVLPRRIFELLLFLIIFKYDGYGSAIPEYFVLDYWDGIGFYINLTATIFFIVMIIFAILGYKLFNIKHETSRVNFEKENSIITFSSLLILFCNSLHPYFYSHYVILIPISISLLLTTFVKDVYSRNIIIPISMVLLGIELYLSDLQYTEYVNMTLRQFFLLEIVFGLILLGLLLFGKGTKIRNNNQTNLSIPYKRIRILNPIFLLKLFNGILVILLVSCLMVWTFSNYNSLTFNTWMILNNFPQVVIFLWVLAPSLMIIIVYSFIQGRKNRKLLAYNRKLGVSYVFFYVYFIGVLIYTYLNFYIFLYRQ